MYHSMDRGMIQRNHNSANCTQIVINQNQSSESGCSKLARVSSGKYSDTEVSARTG